METKKKLNTINHRHQMLSLKKNRTETDDEPKKINRSSDVIVLDLSFDRLKLDKKLLEPMTCSPIVVTDSFTSSDDELPKITLGEKTPSKGGNVSFNCSRNTPSPTKGTQPSIVGWSPAQHIITANPKNNSIPSTPNDKLNTSHEQCSMKTIERSQKKILNELYGESWKSIPTLFKTISHKFDNFKSVSKKLHFDDEKENVREHFKREKELYLSASDIKRNEINYRETEKKSKKKLYTEKVSSTPVLPKQKQRNVNSTTKKVKIKKGMSITEMVEVLKSDVEKTETANAFSNTIKNDVSTNKLDDGESIKKGEISTNKLNDKTVKDVDISTKKRKNGDIIKRVKNDKNLSSKNIECGELKNFDILTNKTDNVEVEKGKNLEVLTKRIENVVLTPKNDVKRLSFMGSLADNVPTWRCHPEAFQYHDNFKLLKEHLSRRLYKEFNREVFGDAMDADMPILWDSKLRSTAGTTTNSKIKNARGDVLRSSRIKLSTKVVDTVQRLRDTLVHEMCHAATWLIDGEMRAGHGPLWKKWASRALQVFPELGEISRCHDLKIHFKYSYQCSRCGYTIQRHSKSIDITKKACGYCHGTFQIVVNKKNKDGVVVTTPARKVTNGFALYVKENYASVKDSNKTHAQVMKLLGEQYSAQNKKS